MIENVHPDYDDSQTMQTIANESETFSSIVNELANYTDEEFQTNEAWLGTLEIDGKRTQVKLVVTQSPDNLIDEN